MFKKIKKFFSKAFKFVARMIEVLTFIAAIFEFVSLA